MLWQILVQFVFRLAFGLAWAMALTSPRRVTCGFFRVHLWVSLGLNTFASVLLWLVPQSVPRSRQVLALSILAGLFSYAGGVVWLYERPRAGRTLLVAVALLDLVAALMTRWPEPTGHPLWSAVDTVSSGLLLGVTISSMLLGHWYLNTPTMKLQPLQRLIQLIGLAVAIRLGVSGAGLIANWRWESALPAGFAVMLALRWLPGLMGVLLMAAMAWQTLKIPNTQSATGILYVAVIFAFLGELCSQLLSLQLPYPL